MQEYYWKHNRRYNSYSEYFKQIFGERVQKVTIDAGFTCPNRDGTISVGGCTYCNNDAFNPSYCKSSKPIDQQINEGVQFHTNRYRRANRYLAYFQAFSNTHASLDTLKQIYQPAINHPQICGLVIGTRPDCIDEQKLEYFAQLSKTKYIIIEYGVESIYNQTLLEINRGHTYEIAEKAIKLTNEYGINTGAHFIFGLPGETHQQQLESVKIVSQLPLKTIKFHQLQIVKGTFMEKDYLNNPNKYSLFSLPDYITFICKYIEQLNPAIVIERFAGEVPPRFLVSEPWSSLRYDQILNLIETKLLELDTRQGKFYEK